MTAKSKDAIPVLKPMFILFDAIQFHNKLVAAFNHIVVGEVCVDKAYRGKGILDNCYIAYKEAFAHKYDFAITEIATKNARSLNAHKRIGFKNVCTYTAPDGVEWQIVIWETACNAAFLLPAHRE
jgi:L-amino acid N-acyltransferase YncA